MKILFISNYAAHLRVSKGVMPSHHMFGAYELVDRFVSDNSAVIKSQYGGGKIDFFVVKNASKVDVCKLYLKSLRYDVVFDTLCVFSKFWGVLNKLHMFPAKLVTIIHHPPFNKMMRYAKSDVSIFFTPALAAMAAGLANDKRIIVPANWYPDTMWYERNKLNVASEKKYDFLDNGKTARDHDLFIRSMRKLPHLRGVIVTDSKHVPAEYREGENIDLYFQDVPNDLNMLPLCVQSRMMLIPLCGKDKGLLGPVGYTSYMDAIALGMPVVSNNNAAYAYELEENKTGLTYSSDADDISQVLQESVDRYEELSANMRAFCNVHSIKDYEKIVIPHLVHK